MTALFGTAELLFIPASNSWSFANSELQFPELFGRCSGIFFKKRNKVRGVIEPDFFGNFIHCHVCVKQ